MDRRLSWPQSPVLLREWLKYKEEFIGAVEHALEQIVQVTKAREALKQHVAGSYTLESLKTKREDLDWAAYFRDQALAVACMIEDKMLLVQNMDNALGVCMTF